MTQGKKRGGVRKEAPAGQKESRRSRDKYPYLNPNNSLVSRREETSDVASYADQLDDTIINPETGMTDRQFMNQFMKEYVNAHTQDGVFHKTAEERKICHDKNNARNRCWYTHETVNNRLNLVGTDQELENLIYTDGELDEVYDETE